MTTLCIRWPKYWSFSFNISPSIEYSGLILKSLLQYHINSSPLILLQYHINSFALSLFYCPNLTSVHDFWKNHNFDCMDLFQQSNVSAFSTLSRFGIAFLPRSKCLWISWLQSLSTVTLEAKKINSVTVFIVSPSIWHEVMGPDARFVFWMLNFKPAFSLSFTFLRWLLNSSLLSATRVVSSALRRKDRKNKSKREKGWGISLWWQ